MNLTNALLIFILAGVVTTPAVSTGLHVIGWGLLAILFVRHIWYEIRDQGRF